MKPDNPFDQFDADEFALLVHLRITERSLADAGPALGWTARKVDRVRKRLARKLQSTGIRPPRSLSDELPSVSYPGYWQRLDSGRRVYSMRRLPPAYAAIVAEQLPVKLLQTKVGVQKAHRVEGDFMSLKIIETKLEQARKTLRRVTEDGARALDAYHTATSVLARAIDAARADGEDAIFEGREPNRTLSQAVAKARTNVAELEDGLELFNGAVRRAQEAVTSLEAEAAERELELMRARFAPAAAKLDEMFQAMAAAAEVVRKLLAETGPACLEEILFPIRNPGAASFEAHQARLAKIQAYNAAFNLLNLRECGALGAYDRRKEVA
jgi:hypothetical protein